MRIEYNHKASVSYGVLAILSIGLLSLAPRATAQIASHNLPFAKIEQSPNLSSVNSSSETTTIYFNIGDVNFRVPRNYLSQMTNYNGGPQEMVTFKVTYPGFEPFTEKTSQCLASAAEYLQAGSGCMALDFRIMRGNVSKLADDDVFQNLRKLFNSQTPEPGPNGFEVYESGLPKPRMRIYRKTTPHTLLITCLINDVHRDMAICTDRPLLADGNAFTYSLDEKRIGEAEPIDNGIRSLLRAMTVKGKEQ